MFKRSRTKRIFAVILASFFLLIPVSTFAISHMNGDCTIEIHADNVNMKNLTDYTQSTTVKFKKGDWFSVKWAEAKPVAAVYWEWKTIPKRALVECLNDAGEVVSSREYANKIRFLTVFPEAGVSEVRMTVLKGSGSMAELFTYNQKQVPSKAVVWEEPLDKADIMLVETHGNDDCLIFGAVLPTYTDRGYRIQVVDLACDTIGRQRESSGGSYLLGLRHFKTFFEFTSLLSSYKQYRDAWMSQSPDPYEQLTAEIRRVRPEVVITHDIVTGESGDASHKLTAEIVQTCVEAAADPAQYPASAEQYGVWQVKKLYMHTAKENPITIDVDTPLASFGGKTAYEISVEAIALWHGGEFPELTRAVKNRKYAPSDYGLVFSTVGEDVKKNDFLENIPAEALSDYVPPTPELTEEPTPTPEPTAEPTPKPTSEPTEAPTFSVTDLSVVSTNPPDSPAPEATPDPIEKAPESPRRTLVWIGLCVGLLILCGIAMIILQKHDRHRSEG